MDIAHPFVHQMPADRMCVRVHNAANEPFAFSKHTHRIFSQFWCATYTHKPGHTGRHMDLGHTVSSLHLHTSPVFPNVLLACPMHTLPVCVYIVIQRLYAMRVLIIITDDDDPTFRKFSMSSYCCFQSNLWELKQDFFAFILFKSRANITYAHAHRRWRNNSSSGGSGMRKKNDEHSYYYRYIGRAVHLNLYEYFKMRTVCCIAHKNERWWKGPEDSGQTAYIRFTTHSLWIWTDDNFCMVIL